VAQIHEAPIIEMALNAMRFEQAQQKALAAKAGKTQGKPTPTRVVPGPATPTPSQARAGNRNADRPGKWASGSGRTAGTRSPMRPS
jgi:hypothetical protein